MDSVWMPRHVSNVSPKFRRFRFYCRWGNLKKFDKCFTKKKSGIGGGTIASRLAQSGLKVLLIEAGSDYDSANTSVPGIILYNFVTRVTAVNTKAGEDPNMRWDFHSEHFNDTSRSYLYPRAS